MIYLVMLFVVVVAIGAVVAGIVGVVRGPRRGSDEPPHRNPSPPPGTRFCPSDGTDCSMADCATGCSELRMIEEIARRGAEVRATKPAGCSYPTCMASTGDCYGPCWTREARLMDARDMALRRQKFPSAPKTPRVGIVARFARSRVR